jgi:ribosomal protein S18 acetylase RimI-like enzyme
MVTLEPMTQETWEAYRIGAIRDYAESKVRTGAWPAEGAVERSEGEFSELLPDGVATPGHDVRSIVDETGAIVGTLWFGPIDIGGRRTCFIYDFEVSAGMRGRGFGRQALDALEPLAREQGYDAISLHVFGDNEVARNLYRSSGYVETDVQMRKSLG